jgi:hypothetical protein
MGQVQERTRIIISACQHPIQAQPQSEGSIVRLARVDALVRAETEESGIRTHPGQNSFHSFEPV